MPQVLLQETGLGRFWPASANCTCWYTMLPALFNRIQLNKAPATSVIGLLYTSLLDIGDCGSLCSVLGSRTLSGKVKDNRGWRRNQPINFRKPEYKEISIIWFLQGVLKQENVLFLLPIVNLQLVNHCSDHSNGHWRIQKRCWEWFDKVLVYFCKC